MANAFSKITWNIWKFHFFIAKKLKLGNSNEEFAVASVFLTAILFSIFFASMMFFLRTESRFAIDNKILTFLFFLLISGVQILYLFNSKKNFKKMVQTEFSFLKIIFFSFIWFLIILIFTFSMIYDFFDGNLNTFFYYLQMHYFK